LQERWGRGAHGSTYGGNPVACAAGLAVLETMRDEGLVENAAVRGAELVAGLGAIAAEDDRIGDIRGLGLMVGVEFVKDRTTREPDPELVDRLTERAFRKGLLLLGCGKSTFRFAPPLVLDEYDVDTGLGILEECLKEED